MRRLAGWLSLSGVWLLTGGCGPQMELSRAAYIIGTDDIKPFQSKASDADKIEKDTLAASALIVTKAKTGYIFCSGTLIENATDPTRSYIVTNHHCFARKTAAGAPLPELIDGACSETSIFLGVSTDVMVQTTCAAGSLVSNVTLDLAVFRTAKTIPSETIRPLKLKSEAVNNEETGALIVHFPLNRDTFKIKQAKLPAPQITKSDCVVKGLFARGDWELDPVLPHSLRHTCDLISGSSGSALVSRTSGEVLGVNWGGVKLKYENKSPVTINAATLNTRVSLFLSNPDATDRYLSQASNTKRTEDTVTRSSSANQRKVTEMKAPMSCGSVWSGSDHGPRYGWLLLLTIPLILASRSLRKAQTADSEP